MFESLSCPPIFIEVVTLKKIKKNLYKYIELFKLINKLFFELFKFNK